MRSEEAQLYTVEAIATAIMIILVVIIVIKAAPLTPNTSSAAHQNVEAQLEIRGQDLLTILDYVPEGSLNSPLKQSIVDWKGDEFLGQEAVRPESLNGTANVLKETLGNYGIVYNLEFSYYTPTGISTYAVLWNGKPSDNAIKVSRKIVFHDEDNVFSSSIIRDMGSGNKFYNIVEVKLTLWRM
jgi:hypothetical protein